MTAFARGERPAQTGTLSCEIKTVNHRYLDVSLRAPTALRTLEPDVIRRVREKLARGRVECYFGLQGNDTTETPAVSTEALTAVAAEMHKVETQLRELGMNPAPPSVCDVMKWPGVMNSGGDDEQLRKDAMQLLDETLEELIGGRRREGERLRDFILENSAALEKTVAKLRKHHPEVIAATREKLSRRLAEVETTVEPERLAQETALLVQKFCMNSDIEEELDRCDSHVRELHAIFERAEPIGRRLDFLMQELNREANTISSKSADMKSTHLAVEAKTLIEQMREQIQNIE